MVKVYSRNALFALNLYLRFIKPMPLYGSEIWGFNKNVDCLEQLQLRFYKSLLNLKSSTNKLYDLRGRIPVEIDITIRMVSFGARLLLGKEIQLCLD